MASVCARGDALGTGDGVLALVQNLGLGEAVARDVAAVQDDHAVGQADGQLRQVLHRGNHRHLRCGCDAWTVGWVRVGRIQGRDKNTKKRTGEVIPASLAILMVRTHCGSLLRSVLSRFHTLIVGLMPSSSSYHGLSAGKDVVEGQGEGVGRGRARASGGAGRGRGEGEGEDGNKGGRAGRGGRGEGFRGVSVRCKNLHEE